MNFTGMPLLEWRYGYPAVVAVSALVVAGLVWYFKRKSGSDRKAVVADRMERPA